VSIRASRAAAMAAFAAGPAAAVAARSLQPALLKDSSSSSTKAPRRRASRISPAPLILMPRLAAARACDSSWGITSRGTAAKNMAIRGALLSVTKGISGTTAEKPEGARK